MKYKMKELKGEIDKLIIIIGDFFSVIDKVDQKSVRICMILTTPYNTVT